MFVGEGTDVENTWEIKISCLISVSRHYGQREGKVPWKLTSKRFTHAAFFILRNIPGKIKADKRSEH